MGHGRQALALPKSAEQMVLEGELNPHAEVSYKLVAYGTRMRPHLQHRAMKAGWMYQRSLERNGGWHGTRTHGLLVANSTCDHVGEFEDQGSVSQIATDRVTALIINHEQVAQRPMNKIEPNVRTHLLRVIVVLDEGV